MPFKKILNKNSFVLTYKKKKKKKKKTQQLNNRIRG